MSKQSDLVAKRNELKANNDKIKKIRDACRLGDGSFDLTKSADLSGEKDARATEMSNLLTKSHELGVEVDNLVAQVKMDTDLAGFDGGEDGPGIMLHGEPLIKNRKSLGERFTESEQFKGALKGDRKLSMEFGDVSLKTLMQTTAGFASQAIRTGEVEQMPVEPIGLFALIPKGQTNQSAYVYMRQNLRTQAAAERAETGNYAESAFTWEQVSHTVEDMGHWIPVTGIQLEDIPQMRGIIDDELRAGIEERLDYELFNGSGSTPSLQGALALTGINVQDAQGQMPLDALYMGMGKVQRLGFAEPNLVAVNGENWEPIQLMKTNDGQYIWGHPADIGPMRVWGRRLVSTYRIAKGTALLGDFSKMLYAERLGITVEITDSHASDFIAGKYAIRARTRGVFAWKRPSAFCKVTNLS
jgi:HK97 family phage major capsid protein